MKPSWVTATQRLCEAQETACSLPPGVGQCGSPATQVIPGPTGNGGCTTCQLERLPVGTCEKASVSPAPTATQRDSFGQETPFRSSLTGIGSSSVEFSSRNFGGSCRSVQF